MTGGEWAMIVVAGIGLAGVSIREILAWRGKRAEVVHEEAEGLWRDAAALRQELREEHSALRAEREGLRSQVAAMTTEVLELHSERAEFRQQIAALTAEVQKLRSELAGAKMLMERYTCIAAPVCPDRKHHNGIAVMAVHES